MDEYLKREMTRGYTGARWEKYFREKAGWLVTLTDGTIFNIVKPRIETSFCFGEHGYDIDEAIAAADAARTREDLFKARNLSGFDKTIKLLKDGPECVWRDKLAVWVDKGVTDTVREVDDTDVRRPYFHGTWYVLSDEDRALLIKGYEIAREMFSKRIDAYLKRYGLSKVHAWTYWADA